MKQTVPLLLLTLLTLSGYAQRERELTKVLELQMPQGPGARGASVAFHPTLKRYYAAIGGNAAHAMAIFDQQGRKLSGNDQKALFDIRGFWWSPELKTFCANGYSDLGWVSYQLDSRGTPVAVNEIFGGMHQPGEHSSGAFNPKTNELYFLDGPDLLVYPIATGEEEKDVIHLHIGASKESESVEYEEEEDLVADEYNTSVVYTSRPSAEFGLLNHYLKTIELYSKATGYITEKLLLPADAPTDEMMCFAYANGIYWLFDRTTRAWKGYK
ncbi:MAG TPA: hypothetical protein VEB40_12015 [Flavipsychrobacter sp.]|nr:hypothetical protein [Flavipsychrobacter sp.]